MLASAIQQPESAAIYIPPLVLLPPPIPHLPLSPWIHPPTLQHTHTHTHTHVHNQVLRKHTCNKFPLLLLVTLLPASNISPCLALDDWPPTAHVPVLSFPFCLLLALPWIWAGPRVSACCTVFCVRTQSLQAPRPEPPASLNANLSS